MSAEILKELLDGLDQAIKAIDNLDWIQAGNIRENVYGSMNAALEAGKLTDAELDAFDAKNAQVWAAETAASQRPAPVQIYGGANPDDWGLGDADVEPISEDWSKELGGDPDQS